MLRSGFLGLVCDFSEGGRFFVIFNSGGFNFSKGAYLGGEFLIGFSSGRSGFCEGDFRIFQFL